MHEVPVPDSSTLVGEQPWPTQPVPELPKPFVKQHFTEAGINDLAPDSSQEVIREKLAQLQTGNMFLPPNEKGTVIFPGFDGGAEWGGAAYDPVTGFLYVNANQVPWILHMVKVNAENKDIQLEKVSGIADMAITAFCRFLNNEHKKYFSVFLMN